jgi:signal peptide peptidase SppA
VKYTHILNYVASTPWAILPSKMDEVLSVLAFRAAGHTFTAEEIQARIGGGPSAGAAGRRGAVAVIPLRGMIAHRMGTMEESSGGMSAERFAAMVNAAAADASVGTILIDVDSPGGTIPGVPEAADAVFKARESKRIVAVANNMMASAAYWIASQAHELVAIPSAIEPSVGSIGVFYPHKDLSAHLEKEGIRVTMIKAGKHKAEGNPFEPLTDDAKAMIQATVDAAYEQFIAAVARGRGVSVSDVRKGYGEGRALSAVDAKAAGLIDRIATMDAVLGGLVGRSKSDLRAEEAFLAALTDPQATAELAQASDMSAVVAADMAEADRLRRLERF